MKLPYKPLKSTDFLKLRMYLNKDLDGFNLHKDTEIYSL